MDGDIRSVTWEALEHVHIERNSDWYWALWIIALSVAVAAFFFGNFLLALLVLVSGGAVTVVSQIHPRTLQFAVTTRGVRVDHKIYPYSSLESYRLDDEDEEDPRLLLKSKKLFMPLLVLPLPEEYVDEIEELVGIRLPEEDLEEPFFNSVLEFFGF